MNYKTSSEISEDLLSKIISLAYGNASLFDRYKITKIIKNDENLKALYEDYCQTAKAVHSLKSEEYEENTDSVAVNSSKKVPSIFEEIYSIFLGKPIVYTTAVTILFISILFSVFSDRQINYNGYSLAEVKKANRESKIALGIVAEIFIDTEKRLKTDILYNEISKPINEGIKTVNKLFKKEIKK